MKWIGYLFIVCLVLNVAVLVKAHGVDNETCALIPDPPSSEFIISGGFLLLIFGAFISLWCLAYTCEELLVPAIAIFCSKWSIPDSVAGSLVLAACNDAPEIFVSFLGIFVQHNSIGLGTVVGSEIFNHMVISAGCAYYAPNGILQLDPYHFSRDCAAYFVSLIVFLWTIDANIYNTFNSDAWDRCLTVTVTSSMVLIACQLFYCVIIAYFSKIETFFGKSMIDPPVSSEAVVNTLYSKLDVEMIENEIAKTPTSGNMSREVVQGNTNGSCTSAAEASKTESEVAGNTGSAGDGDSAFLQYVFTIVSCCTCPMKSIIDFTTPKVHNVSNHQLEVVQQDKYGYAIVSCTLWLSIFSYALCECLSQLGVYLHISSVVMGLTFSAVGTSFPNMWSSLVVAKIGRGNMAISNALGSNTLNIFVALGLPWLVYTCSHGDYNKLQDGGIVILTSLLLVILLMYYILIWACNFRLYSW